MEHNTEHPEVEKAIDVIMNLLKSYHSAHDVLDILDEVRESDGVEFDFAWSAINWILNEKVLVDSEGINYHGRSSYGFVLTREGRYDFKGWAKWVKKKNDEGDIPSKTLMEKVLSNQIAIAGMILNAIMAVIGFIVGRYT